MVDTAAEGQGLLQRLFSLDVATIVTSSISDEKQPPPSQMIERLAATYERYVTDPNAAAAPGGAPSPVTASSLRALSARANAALVAPTAGVMPAPGSPPVGLNAAMSNAPWMAERIARNAHRLAEIVERYGDPAPTGGVAPGVVAAPGDPAVDSIDDAAMLPADVAIIAKAYEVADEPLGIRTTVWLDGDIVTRVTTSPGLDMPALESFHSLMVTESLDQWNFLMHSVTAFIRALSGFFLGSPNTSMT